MQIIETFIQRKCIENFSVLVPYKDIESKNLSFSAGQYFEVKIEHIALTPQEFQEKIMAHQLTLTNLIQETQHLQTRVLELLEGIKYE